MEESYTLYHPSYTSAINAALQKHSDLNVSDEDRDTHIAMGPRKPAEGETVKHNIPATDKNGDPHMIHIQVYNKGGNKPFELNTYSSKISKKKVAEETEMRHSSDSLGDHMALKAYANKLGPKHIDRHDLLTAASHMAFGNMDHLKKHLKALDTDVRDKALEYVARRHHAELGYRVHKEEADQIDEMRSALIPHDHDEAKEMTPAEKKARYDSYVKTANHHGKRKLDPSLTNGQRMASSAVHTAARMAAAEWKNKYMKEEEDLDEAIKLGSKVRIHNPGKRNHGEEGTVGEIHRGLPGVRPKYYTVDHGGTSSQLPKENLRIVKEEAEQIDEISSATLISYSQKAHDQIKGNQPADPDKLRKRTNREQGIKLAFNKHYQVRTKVPATIKEANSHREVDDLKSKGKHHEAGQHAAKSGHDRQYGPHFGMRSDKEEAQRQFFKGYDSVKKTNEEVKPLAEISAALAMRASRAATKEVGMGKSNREDKLIGLQKTADEKYRKMQGHSSSAKVATTPEE